jgi:hypothetical protein
MRDAYGKFRYSDARDWLVAEWTRHGSVVDFEETEKRVRRALLPVLRKGLHLVVPGFICRAPDGSAATLGRNGSDYSAAIVGAALRSREIWIYTDVDGIMTADPNLVAEASILDQISYQEAAEMSYFGAKILHPKTMIPAVVRRARHPDYGAQQAASQGKNGDLGPQSCAPESAGQRHGRFAWNRFPSVRCSGAGEREHHDDLPVVVGAQRLLPDSSGRRRYRPERDTQGVSARNRAGPHR